MNPTELRKAKLYTDQNYTGLAFLSVVGFMNEPYCTQKGQTVYRPKL